MSGEVVSFESHSVEETLDLGRRLGAVLAAGDVVGLVGPLGAGKTMLVKGVVSGLGMADTRRVSSPTYILVKEYAGRLHVYHVDAYRLGGPQELLDAGFEEMCSSGGAVFVEWADRVRQALPADCVQITITPTGENSRAMECLAKGPAAAALLQRLETLG